MNIRASPKHLLAYFIDTSILALIWLFRHEATHYIREGQHVFSFLTY